MKQQGRTRSGHLHAHLYQTQGVHDPRPDHDPVHHWPSCQHQHLHHPNELCYLYQSLTPLLLQSLQPLLLPPVASG